MCADFNSKDNSHDKSHAPADLIAIFDQLFGSTENTRLVRGDGEPIYQPADQRCRHHQVVFAHGYFASALHEISHWCIAGKQRRERIDYGYWYAPDGRDAQQQAEFERVEVKPQALEWILSKACGKSFRVSIDNLDGVETDPSCFKRAVYEQVLHYCDSGLPPRARQFREALVAFYKTPDKLLPQQFSPAEIDLEITADVAASSLVRMGR